MLKVRIVPCLDVLDDKVVKGVQFSNHIIVGDIVTLNKAQNEEVEVILGNSVKFLGKPRDGPGAALRRIQVARPAPLEVTSGMKLKGPMFPFPERLQSPRLIWWRLKLQRLPSKTNRRQ